MFANWYAELILFSLATFLTVSVHVMRVPGIPVRDCTRGYRNRAQMCAQLIARDVTEKIFFERVLVLKLGTFGP